jgi:cobalt-zinc-cadmium resistance protein CzcA
VTELQSSLRRYSESLNHYNASALKEAQQLLNSAKLQLQNNETSIADYILSVTTARDIQRNYIETVYQYNIAALEYELYK